MGLVAAERKHKSAVTITWKYAAGEESVKGFREGFEAKGGKITKELSVPFPTVERRRKVDADEFAVRRFAAHVGHRHAGWS